MKKFYLHNGKDQEGPFDIDDLKAKNITKETSIWYDGISEWTTAEKIADLNALFKTRIPPPFTAKTIIANQPIKNKSRVGRTIFIMVGLLIIIVGGFLVVNNINSNSGSGIRTGGDTYQEKVMTVEEIERSKPTNFLTASNKYKENLWGDQIKVRGIIKNTATIATYKDAIVRVTYYSKTKTKLGSKEYSIYETFPPHSEVKFELKIENYKDVNSIGLEVIQATAY